MLRGKVQIVFSSNWAVLCALWMEGGWGGGGLAVIFTHGKVIQCSMNNNLSDSDY